MPKLSLGNDMHRRYNNSSNRNLVNPALEKDKFLELEIGVVIKSGDMQPLLKTACPNPFQEQGKAVS